MAYRISDLPGVGETTAAALHEAGYETLDEVRSAEAVDLLRVDHVGPRTVRQLMDADPTPPDIADDMITYQFTIDEADWKRWTDTLPEDVAIKHELRSLIRRSGLNEDADTVDIKIAAIQMRRHAMVGLQSVPKSNPEAKDAFNQIMRLTERIV